MKMVSRGSIVHVIDNESDILENIFSQIYFIEFDDTRSSLLILVNVGSEEKERMKKCIQFYLSIGGDSLSFMNDLEVYNDYVESLDSEEISKNKNKFDNASQDVIHKKTNSLFKDTITRMRRRKRMTKLILKFN
jgi:hypothetical protein